MKVCQALLTGKALETLRASMKGYRSCGDRPYGRHWLKKNAMTTEREERMGMVEWDNHR